MSARPENESNDLSDIRSAGRAIAPLHDSIGATNQGDWLDEHDEPGQSFDEYRLSDPALPTNVRTTMYLQPLGDFDPARATAIEATAELLGHFYGAPIRMLDRMDLAWVPDQARRLHPYTGVEQVQTKFVLRLLARKKPADAAAVLALTTSDLWPGEGWNFVFGQASLSRGVGIWSLHRLGDPEVEPRTFLRRTAKIALHETGHMLGIRHCAHYRCGMNGANHQDEADGQPLWFCPEDEMKIWWGCRVDPADRYRRLSGCAAAHELEREAEFWRTSERAVRENGSAWLYREE
jgi:archaemetzincin